MIDGHKGKNDWRLIGVVIVFFIFSVASHLTFFKTLCAVEHNVHNTDVGDDGGINPRRQYKMADFKSMYWIGDMIDENKLFAVVMDNTVSTGGLSFTSTNNGKGKLALTLTPHASLEDQEKIPMAFYILEKVGA